MIEYVLGISWGIFVGFAIAVPVGPVGLICIQRTFAKNKTSGLVSGLGAALADALLASVGAFSITVIFLFIKQNHALLQILGGGLLLLLGVMALVQKKKDNEPKTDTTLGFIEEALSAFILTITNPLSAFSFFVAFAGISHKLCGGFAVAISFVIGAFIGSCLWWIFLTGVTDRIAHRINQNHIKSASKWFSIIITVFGAIILIGVFFK